MTHMMHTVAMLPEGEHELREAHGSSQLEVLCRSTSLASAAIALGLITACYLNLSLQDPLIHLGNVVLWQNWLEAVVLSL